MSPVAKRVFLVLGGLLAIIVVAFFVLGIWGPKYVKYLENKRQEYTYNKAVVEPARKLEEAYKKDTVGGKTPEETMDLFITALKKGDIEGASKFYVVEDQEQIRKELVDVFSNKDKTNSFISYYENIFTKGTLKCNESKVGCGYELITYAEKTSTTTSIIGGQQYQFVVPQGAAERSVEGLKMNEYTGVWKLQILK